MKPKTRVSIPAKVRDAILNEFNHRCAICGNDRPQLHHIDENPSNNDPLNLLPLCPNCHLIDQHAPTRQIGLGRLRLFREFKDPVILCDRFQPLYERMKFLEPLNRDSSESQLRSQATELLKFISALKMGEFYEEQIKPLILLEPEPRIYSFDTPEATFKKWREEERETYLFHLEDTRWEAIALIIEMLRYQDWSLRPNEPAS